MIILTTKIPTLVPINLKIQKKLNAYVNTFYLLSKTQSNYIFTIIVFKIFTV